MPGPPLAGRAAQAAAGPALDCILTPNFTYEVECALVPDFLDHPRTTSATRRQCPGRRRGLCSTPIMRFPLEQGQVPLFHIHGEARVPNTVILGHYYYGNLLFCCDEYLTHRAPERRYPIWPGREEMPALSWLDYFILGDVYSLGFGFDTSEMDLWWLLCRKKRELAPPRGPVVLRAGPEVRRDQARPAGSLSRPVRQPGGDGARRGDYQDFYERAVEELSRRLGGTQRENKKEGTPAMKKPHYGWVICITCTLLLFVTMGTVSNGFSIYLPYIMEEKGLTHAQTSSLVTLRCLVAFGHAGHRGVL